MTVRPSLVAVLRRSLVVLALVAVSIALYVSADDAQRVLRRSTPLALGSSLTLGLVGLLLSALSWRVIVNGLGASVSTRDALHVFFVGQLGKYLPGSVFNIALQMELGRARGASRDRTVVAGLLFLGFGLVAALVLAGVALPLSRVTLLGRPPEVWALLAGAGLLASPAVLNILLRVVARLSRGRLPVGHVVLTWRTCRSALVLAVLMSLAYGAHLYLLLPSDARAADGALLLALGSYGIAWSVGLLLLVAPAGAGVREAALVVTLAPLLEPGAALAVAVLSRVLMTVGDLLWGVAGLLLGRRRPGAGGAAGATVAPLQQLGKAADA